MKYFSIFLLSAVMVYGCAKKNVPVAPTPSSEKMKEPDAMKMPAVDLRNGGQALAGMETYNGKCGRCHKLKNTADYTIVQWTPIMNRMAMKAHLDTTEKANVIVYVQTHAKDS